MGISQRRERAVGAAIPQGRAARGGNRCAQNDPAAQTGPQRGRRLVASHRGTYSSGHSTAPQGRGHRPRQRTGRTRRDARRGAGNVPAVRHRERAARRIGVPRNGQCAFRGRALRISSRCIVWTSWQGASYGRVAAGGWQSDSGLCCYGDSPGPWPRRPSRIGVRCTVCGAQP